MEPRVSPFNDPAEFTQATAMFGAPLRDHRLDATITQALAVRLGVVAAIGVDDFGFAKRSAPCATNRWNGIPQWQQLSDVVAVCSGQSHPDRHSVGVYEDVMFGSRSRAIRGVRPSFSPEPTARTDDESTAAYGRPNWPDSRNLSSGSPCKLFQMPAFCQAFSRRQHVAPEPNPNWVGRWFQRIPVRNTNRIPLSARRSDTRGRPRRSLFRRLGCGDSGSINVHNSSSMVGACIPSVSVACMAEVSSLPKRLTAPRGDFL
jgi:hypothetical protein